MDYRDFIDGLNLRHFSADELIAQAHRVRGDVTNSLPPEQLWSAIVPTLWIADQVRHHTGISLTVTSAYRSPDYNAKCPNSSPRSQHMANTALDLIPGGGRLSTVFDAFKQMRKAGAFRGGLGRYSSFIHIDTRGRNATWG